MGWNAVPGAVIITGILAATIWGVEQLNVIREEKPLWSYNKDYYQRAILRRDWYLKREAELVQGTK